MAEKEKKAMLTKVNGFRQELLGMDWSDDKIFSAGNRSYGYVSADRVKANFGPLVAKHGLEMVFSFDELQSLAPMGMMSQHWALKATMTLIDIESGEGLTYSAYGEAGDSGDKGINKAQTDALKQVIFSSFMVADEGDPSAVSVDTIAPVASKFKPKSEEEQVAVKSKVQERAVKAPAPKPKAPAPKAEAPKEEPKAEAPKVTPKPKVAKPVAKAVEEAGGEVPETLIKVAKKIVVQATMDALDGTKTHKEVDELKAEAEGLKTLEDYQDFIGRHQA